MPIPQKGKSIKGLVAYSHPTIFGKEGAPSRNSDYEQALAGLYAANNYGLLVPNYLGFNLESSEPHPYILYPETTVRTMIATLNDAVPFLKEKYPDFNLNLYSAGYSEGAGYSLWLHKCLQEGCHFTNLPD